MEVEGNKCDDMDGIKHNGLKLNEIDAFISWILDKHLFSKSSRASKQAVRFTKQADKLIASTQHINFKVILPNVWRSSC